jgi:hypothetical protein
MRREWRGGGGAGSFPDLGQQIIVTLNESRNRLSTSTVSDLLMIIGHWNATTYVVSWLEAGRHRALDAPRGVPKRQVESPIKCKLSA